MMDTFRLHKLAMTLAWLALAALMLAPVHQTYGALAETIGDMHLAQAPVDSQIANSATGGDACANTSGGSNVHASADCCGSVGTALPTASQPGIHLAHFSQPPFLQPPFPGLTISRLFRPPIAGNA